MSEGLPKGYQMEELLRRYFIRSGYFTVRGVPFVYEGFEVTDIDIWLYDRPSSVSLGTGLLLTPRTKALPKQLRGSSGPRGSRKFLV